MLLAYVIEAGASDLLRPETSGVLCVPFDLLDDYTPAPVEFLVLVEFLIVLVVLIVEFLVLVEFLIVLIEFLIVLVEFPIP